MPNAILFVMSLHKSHNFSYAAEGKAIPVRWKFICGHKSTKAGETASGRFVDFELLT